MMEFHFPHVLLLFFIFVIFHIRNLTGSLECDNISGLCCANYYRENHQCKECPLGTYGVNCSWACPQDYFGRFCKKSCNCSIHQYCSPAFGCVQKENVTEKSIILVSNRTAATNQAFTQNTSGWKITIFAFLLSTVIGLSTTGIISFKLRAK
ncbi:uncharacterized protein LOC128186493 isoform X1 [Crassostrea angulata]|uniref:uncharacterized protein LOC128186493 isoform X1 n=1 Tax=Magallana angulata TaxID=2784310 RepID=UPI0022B21A29|nr:uncharacterized protein LOC128186493 isoform X1 [Crassostrea angulata]